MGSALGWLGSLMERLISFIPQLIIVRATHKGLKWRRGKKVLELKPGLHLYWPLVTEVDLIVVARQTNNLPTQVLMTRDMKSVVVGTVVIYRIEDVVKAVGEKNWDVDSTINDITQAVLIEIVANSTIEEILSGIAGGQRSDLNKSLTGTLRRQLKQFGVYVDRCGITDFSTCRVYKILGGDLVHGIHEE